MNRLQCGNWKFAQWLAVGAASCLLAQGMASAQTSEDKSQSAHKTLDKMNGKIAGKKDAPSSKADPKPEPTKPLALAVTTDKKMYAAGAAIKMTLTAKNTTPQTMNLNFNSGQQYDFTLREGVKPDGKIIWQWAKGRMFAQMIRSVKLEPGKSLTFTETLTPKTIPGGDALKAGTYTLTAALATFGERPTATTQVIVK